MVTDRCVNAKLLPGGWMCKCHGMEHPERRRGRPRKPMTDEQRAARAQASRRAYGKRRKRTAGIGNFFHEKPNQGPVAPPTSQRREEPIKVRQGQSPEHVAARQASWRTNRYNEEEEMAQAVVKIMKLIKERIDR